MDNALSRLPRNSKVAVVCLHALGECVLTTPALTLLKRYRPDLRVAVVAERAFHAVFQGNPDVTAVFPPHLPPLWSWRPRLCVDLQGGWRSVLLTELSGAEITAGFRDAKAAWAYSVPLTASGEHLAVRFASAVFQLGVPPAQIPPAVLPFGDQRGKLTRVVIYPFADSRERTWPAESFLDTARKLATWGFDVVFAAGRGENLRAFPGFPAATAESAAQWIALLCDAALFIGNLTGVTQVAAALQVPQVVLCPVSGPGQQAPWKSPAEVLTATEGMASIDPAQVLAAVARLGVKP